MRRWRARVCGFIIAALAVPVSAAASEGERAPSWAAIVWQWVERVVAAVGGGPPEDSPGPPPVVPPFPPLPPEHSNAGGESGPEIDPNG